MSFNGTIDIINIGKGKKTGQKEDHEAEDRCFISNAIGIRLIMSSSSITS